MEMYSFKRVTRKKNKFRDIVFAMMNERAEIVLWYIDMIAVQGFDVDNVPYFDDLYLDLIVYPDGTIIVDDMDELEAALVKGSITQDQFFLAIETSIRLKETILSDISSFTEYTKKFGVTSHMFKRNQY